MLIPALFFIATFATLVALAWAMIMVFQNQEDPLGDRLEELQAHAMAGAARAPRRKGGGGFFNSFLYFVSMLGGEEFIRETDRELAQAGIRHTYEEFDDDHSDVDYRMDRSLPFLYRALK